MVLSVSFVGGGFEDGLENKADVQNNHHTVTLSAVFFRNFRRIKILNKPSKLRYLKK